VLDRGVIRNDDYCTTDSSSYHDYRLSLYHDTIKRQIGRVILRLRSSLLGLMELVFPIVDTDL
jgi:hypothetical protein